MKKPELKGIIPPVVTPLTENKNIDVKGLERLIEHLLSGGVHGLFILGTTGESASLSHTLRKEMIRRTSELVKGRIPLFAGITDTSIIDSLELAHYSAEMGCDAVVVAPPYYLPISQEELRDYLEELAHQLPLPFIMYNMPSCTKLHMTMETVRKAHELGAIGIKDSSGDISYLLSLTSEFSTPDFSVMTGTELFIPETILNGGQGAIPGGANLFPKLFVSLYDASIRRDHEKIKELMENLIAINSSIYNIGRHDSRIIKGIKSGLRAMNICDDYVLPPLTRHSLAELEKISMAVASITRSLRCVTLQ